MIELIIIIIIIIFLSLKNGGLYGYITPSGRAPDGLERGSPISGARLYHCVGSYPTKDAHQRTPAGSGIQT